MGIALSPDSRWAATCSRDNSLQLWNCENGVFQQSPHDAWSTDVTFVLDGPMNRQSYCERR